MQLVILTAMLGVLLSCYAWYIEKKKKKEKTYQAACDINKKISCSKAFTSPYSHLFGISNSLLGIGAYSTIILMALLQPTTILFLTLPGFLMSLYLAYISFVKLKNFCVVCMGIYLINIILLILSL